MCIVCEHLGTKTRWRAYLRGDGERGADADDRADDGAGGDGFRIGQAEHEQVDGDALAQAGAADDGERDDRDDRLGVAPPLEEALQQRVGGREHDARGPHESEAHGRGRGAREHERAAQPLLRQLGREGNCRHLAGGVSERLRERQARLEVEPSERRHVRPRAGEHRRLDHEYGRVVEQRQQRQSKAAPLQHGLHTCTVHLYGRWPMLSATTRNRWDLEPQKNPRQGIDK
eukprot:1621190-Prymnesium_polylepis.3